MEADEAERHHLGRRGEGHLLLSAGPKYTPQWPLSGFSPKSCLPLFSMPSQSCQTQGTLALQGPPSFISINTEPQNRA